MLWKFRMWLLLTLAGLAGLPVGELSVAGSANKIVRVWHTETEPATVEALENIAQRFEAANPGVTIQIEGLAWAELESRISAALVAGAPPELSHGQPITCTALQAKGLLLPLDEVVEAVGEGNIWGQVKSVCHVEGHQYGLVHAVATSLLLYRKDMADTLNIQPPRSWRELEAAVKALTQDTDGDGKVDVYGVSIAGDNLFINIILGELIKANGAALFDRDHRPMLTDARVIEVLDHLRVLLRHARPGWEGRDYLQSYQDFVGGRTAVMLSGFGRGAGLIERTQPKHIANDDTFAVWPKPTGPSGSQPATQVDEEPWMLFKGARHTKEAIAFLKFFYKDENYLGYVSTVPIHLLPITKSLNASAQYQNLEMFQRWRSWLDMQNRYLKSDQAKPALVIEWSDLVDRPYLLDVLDSGILRDMVIDVAIERMTSREAAEKAQHRLDALLAGRGYRPGASIP